MHARTHNFILFLARTYTQLSLSLSLANSNIIIEQYTSKWYNISSDSDSVIRSTALMYRSKYESYMYTGPDLYTPWSAGGHYWRKKKTPLSAISTSVQPLIDFGGY